MLFVLLAYGIKILIHQNSILTLFTTNQKQLPILIQTIFILFWLNTSTPAFIVRNTIRNIRLCY